MLLALDRMVVEVSMQLYNLNRSERSRMRRQNRRRLHRQPGAVIRHVVRRSRRAYPFSSEIAARIRRMKPRFRTLAA